MKASSSSYVTLQNLYKAKAKEDVAEVRRILEELSREVGVDGEKRVDDEMVESFVKHAAWVKVVRGRRVKEEYDGVESRLKGKIGTFSPIFPSSRC
jgi:amyloid beta precursor protein binding protein 1